MIKRSPEQTESLVANDGTLIREVLHPLREGLAMAYSLAHATLPPGGSSRSHRLAGHNEVYVIRSGQATVFVGEEQTVMRAGDVVFIPAGTPQYIRNDSDREELAFWCIVDPPYEAQADQLL